MKIRYFFSLLLLLFSFSLFANNLVVTLNDDLPKLIKKNIHGYLGELPTQEQDRLVFLASAKQKIVTALQALGYYRSKIKTDVIKAEKTNIWTLKLEVNLNQPTIISSFNLAIVGEAQTDAAFQSLLATASINSGDVLHHGTYEQLKSALLTLGLQRGYFDQKLVDSRIAIHKSYQNADITINYQSGKRYRFGDVSFNETTIDPEIIQALIPFNQGDYYTVTPLQELQNNLEQTNYFGNIIITPSKPFNDSDALPINIALEKAKSHHVDVGFGYATDTGFRTSLGWRTPLVNRYGHKQETKLEYSLVNPSGRFSYSIPLTHPLNDVLQFQLLLKNDDFGDINSTYWVTQLGRVRNENNWIRQTYLRYLREDWDIDGFSDYAEYVLPGLTWSRSTRKGSPLDPSEGFKQYYNVEATHTALGSETSFIRFNARWKYITTLIPNHRLVARAEAGIAKIDPDHYADLAPSLRFFAGGDQSIRGHDYQSIGPSTIFSKGANEGKKSVVGGTHLVTASLEYQYYFAEKWRSALFIDGGSVTNHTQLQSVYSIGSGIHYISPVGAIRLDFGYSISEESPAWRIHFTLGAEL